MNPASNNPVAASAVALALAPPQPHRPSTSCDRHPEELFTGFCPSCLFDRLSVLDVTTTNAVASSSRKPPSSSSVSLKPIHKFPSSSSGIGTSQQPVIPGLSFPELRRIKSFSATKNEAFSLSAFEPQRRSCDVKVRNTLWSLFNEDAEHTNSNTKESFLLVDREIGLQRGINSPVFEEKSKIESERDIEEDIDCGNLKDHRSVIDEIVEVEEDEETKKAKYQMEFNFQTKKKPSRDFKEIAGSFLSAASVFSKKLQKWRNKQKLKKHRGGGFGVGSAAFPVEKSIGTQLRDTQSEIAEYGYGRRSCDTDPRFSIDAGRFSLDAGRVSVDDPRYSFDEPRASWDGYMIGRTVAQPRMPSMLSVVEDSPVSNHIRRSDTQIPLEEPSPRTPQAPMMDEIIPGGSTQTREYYTDSSSRRRKSLDRSSSTRKISASIIAEINELKMSTSNTKVSSSQNRVPKDLISHSHSHSHSQRDDCSVENIDIGVRENARTIELSKKETKKSKRWSWNIFGMLHKKNGNKYEEDDKRNGVERTFSNVETRKEFDPKMMRSNSSLSWRSSGTGGGVNRRNSVDGYVNGKKKVSNNERRIENGMMKLYLTPSKERRRGSSDSTGLTNRPVQGSHPLARNVSNFY